MTYVWLIFGWIFSLIFLLLAISMILMKNWIPAVFLLLAVFLSLPPVGAILKSYADIRMFPLIRGVAVVVLFVVSFGVLVTAKPTSVYKSPEIKTQFMEMYNRKMADWSVPYNDIFVNTQYGKVHIIASGNETNQAMLLLHASGVSSWSWKYNVVSLSQQFRTYAIDLIGDAGKSEFTTLEHILKTGKDQADLYAEICDSLGIDKAYVVGASEGGFIGSNFAIHYPERVEKLVLLGPMGYAGATQSVMRIMLAQFFPLKSIQEHTFRWAFTNDPGLEEEFGEWFRLVMNGLRPVKVAPLPLTAADRQRIRVPVMFVFGTKDNLVGNPEAAKSLVQDISNVRVEIVEAGHLMGAEQPQLINSLINDFMGID